MRPLKLSEAAKRLGITKKTLYVWKKEGKIDFIRVGGLNFLDYDIFCDLAHIKQKKKLLFMLDQALQITKNC